MSELLVPFTYDYMLKSYLAFKLVYPNVNSVIRHVKLA